MPFEISPHLTVTNLSR